MRYPDVDPQPNFAELELDVLARWAKDDTFVASVDRRPPGDDGANEFVFYDGPPFANGLPHYGHLLTGFVKDAIPRYQTMRGRRVERRFGWDCHGLPAEVKAEQELGISGHPEIIAFGIDRFNEACRTSVLRYTDEWREYVTRQARWVDFDNDYKTLDLPYMESVMWAFKTLWDKGLIYEGFRVIAYCWRCETPLSNTETRMDDVYRDRQDPALTVGFELLDTDGLLPDGSSAPVRLLAWTTTPWTLPANLALAVGPDIEYAVVELDGVRYVIADALLSSYAVELGEAVRVGSVVGAALAGRRYTPLFDDFADTPNAFVVLPADFVSTEDGTGIVHMAPGFGEDDQIVANAAGIPTICPMDEHGRYTADVAAWAGTHVFDANPLVIRALKDRGVVLRHATYDHAYPHCWRCAQPLVYRAISSWFVRVTAVRDRMVELNQQINWQPAHIKDGSFGKWLENARDWSISRNRFWGSPIPVWQSDDPAHPRIDVYGSLAELEADFGVVVTDLHRPHVDDLVRPNPDDPTGRSTMRRVPEVLDCWFESGSMPFAQVHYPFENADWFEHHYPGDFIVEYIGQTRGWFYTLHVLATALFDRPAFSNCVSHGNVLGDDGRKMSKSLNNYPDPREMFDTHGADAMRWHLLSSPILRGGDGMVTEEGMRDTVRQVLLPLWNSWYFLTLYANAADGRGRFDPTSTHELDRYILSKTRRLIVDMTVSLDAHDLYAATHHVRAYLDVLTNWYVRRSRQRFWDGDRAAIDTLHTALTVTSLVAAPLLPLLTEVIHAGLSGGDDSTSVHLADWPDPDLLPDEPELVDTMDLVRDVCSATLSVRKSKGLRVRQPLPTLTVATRDAERLVPFADIIAEEVNVKDVAIIDDIASVAEERLQLVPSVLGPRLGRDVQHVIAAHKRGEWTVTDGEVEVGGHRLLEGEYSLELVAAAAQPSAGLPGESGVVVLDVDVSPELEREGRARDLVRLVQQARKDARLDVSDRIEVEITADPSWLDAGRAHESLLRSETLAERVVYAAAPDGLTAPAVAVRRIDVAEP